MIRIFAFGGLSIRNETDGQSLTGSAAQPRRMAALALLARAGSRGMPREKLQAMLWPDADDERGPRTLAQAIYALRQDLKSDSAITGTSELKLDPELISSDVADFQTAISRGNEADAAALYTGPFLDGFHLPGLAEFSRWIDAERRTLAQDYARVLELLARDATHKNNLDDATNWWRKLAALDPLNARFAIGLMQSLAALGDRAGAIKHARIYEVLLEQELNLAPDREVVLLAQRLRSEPDAVAAPSVPMPTIAMPAPAVPIIAGDAQTLSDVGTSAPVLAPVTPALATPTPTAVAVAAPAAPQPVRARRTTRPLIAVAAMLLAAVAVWINVRTSNTAQPTSRIVAIGRISEYATDAGGSPIAAPLGDLLATNLARVPNLHVVSPVRMLELARQSSTANDTSAGAVIAAARAAGATDMVDGTLYRRNNKPFRLDLRRIDLATGSIVDVRSVDGADLFALVDSGTARIALSLGAATTPGPVVQVTTRSDAAYQLYAQALHRFYEYDQTGAEALLKAAVKADTTFAMAAYYLSLVTVDPRLAVHRMARAVELSSRATDRERLIIRADAAYRFSSPELAFIAETLATRYPNDPEGTLYRGTSLVLAEDYLRAIPLLQREIAMDSGTNSPVCNACTAFSHLVYAYKAVDSASAAEREARRWTRVFPRSPAGYLSLAGVLSWRGNIDESVAMLRKAMSMDGRVDQVAPAAFAVQYIQHGDYDRAKELLRPLIETGTPFARGEAHWNLSIIAREQGQLQLAIAEARKQRWAMNDTSPQAAAAASGTALLLGAMLDEGGQYREAAALFDSVAQMRTSELYPSGTARRKAWALTHMSTALFGMRDTARLAKLADSIQTLGAQSAFGRDQRLHHYVRGLLLIARGRDADAITEIEMAVKSRIVGYTRASYVLAQAYNRQRRHKDAIAVLQPALRGDIDGSNLYISRTLLREELAKAWAAQGVVDSAAVQYANVSRVWSGGDAPYKVRAQAASKWVNENARKKN